MTSRCPLSSRPDRTHDGARLNGRPVVAGLHVPTDDLVPVAGGPS